MVGASALLDSQLRLCWTSAIAKQLAAWWLSLAEDQGLTRLCQLKGWQLPGDRRAPASSSRLDKLWPRPNVETNRCLFLPCKFLHPKQP